MPISWSIADQGRSDYLEYPRLRAQATVFLKFHGVKRVVANDDLGIALRSETNLPFLPLRRGYDAWRNYARMFMTTLLATLDKSDCYVATDVCRAIASGDWSVDDYLAFLAMRRPMPSEGATRSYFSANARSWPISILLKYLAENGAATLDDVAEVLIAGSFVGDESPEAFASATRHSPYSWGRDERRQLREFVEFISQFSFLTWNGKDTVALRPGTASEMLYSIATPDVSQPAGDAREETLRLGTIPAGWKGFDHAVRTSIIGSDEEDRKFAEGSRAARTHVAIERDPHLRKEFLKRYPGALVCDICGIRPSATYPWLLSRDSLIEIHHRLPLSSGAHSGETRVEDCSPLCPSCHRAVHRYYQSWLTDNGHDDFPDEASAEAAYLEAKGKHMA